MVGSSVANDWKQLERQEYQQALAATKELLATNPQTCVLRFSEPERSGLHRHQEADALFTRAAQRANGFPDDVAALRAWADTLLHLKQWRRAISVLATVLESVPIDADALYKVSVARIRLRRFDAPLRNAKQLAKLPGHVASIDPSGNHGTSLYDSAGRNVATIDPLGNHSTTAYDSASQVIASINSPAFRTSFSYDASQCLTAR